MKEQAKKYAMRVCGGNDILSTRIRYMLVNAYMAGAKMQMLKQLNTL